MRGGCLCGTVRFEVTGPLPKLYQCQGSLRRKQGGSASNTSAVVDAAQLRWLAGEDAVATWRKDTGFRSHFCSTCGSTLPNPTRHGRRWRVPVGLLDDDEQLETAAQLCLGSKVRWDTVPGPGARFDDKPDVATLCELLGPEDPAGGPPADGAALQPAVTLLTLGVPALERAVAFYREGLGWPANGIVAAGIEHGAVAFFALRSGLKLAPWPRESIAADTGLPEDGPAPTAFELAHNVSPEAAVDVAMRQVEHAGARIVNPAQRTAWGGYAGYFADPDGHL